MMMDNKYYEVLDMAESAYVGRKDLTRELLDIIYKLEDRIIMLEHTVATGGRVID